MLATTTEIKLTNEGRKRQLWLPVRRGTHHQRLGPHLAGQEPLAAERAAGLQPVPLQERAGGKATKITISEPPFLRALLPVSTGDAKRQGYRFPQHAVEAFEAAYGPVDETTEVWVINFALGDRSQFYRDHLEQYLRAKLGGGRAYTTIPSQAVRDEGAVPDNHLAAFAAKARATREGENIAKLKNLLNEIGTVDPAGLPEPLRRRAANLEKAIAKATAA